MDPLLEEIYSLSAQERDECGKHLMIGGGTRGGPTLVRGRGIRVEGVDGKTYIDCTSQSWAMYLGFAHPDILRVIREHSENLTHVHQGFDTLPRYYLARKLAQLAPGSLNRVSFTVGGGPAVEAAMKIAVKNRPGATEFISQYDSYHGTTLMAMGASWIATRASGKYVGGSRFLPLLKSFVRVPNPYCYRCPLGHRPETCNIECAEMLRTTMERGVNGPVAGVIVEPLQASGGQIPARREYLQRVREICDEFGALLIFDEIQTYCRIGRWFAAAHYGVEPDVIVLGKGLGGGLPLAAIIVRDGLVGFEPDAEELHTFASPTLSFVTAAKQIEVIMRDRLLENACNQGAYIASRLAELQADFPEIGDIRQVGLHIGVEFVRDPEGREPLEEETVRLRDEGIRRGVIFGLGGVRKNVLKIKPPLIVTREEADEIIDVLEACLHSVFRHGSARTRSRATIG